MTPDQIWNDERPISWHGIDVPEWIDQGISPSTVAAIVQGGCTSGAYMSAVTYHQARATMHEHGDAVLDYLAEIGEDRESLWTNDWSSLCCNLLSRAVDLWAQGAYGELEDVEEE